MEFYAIPRMAHGTPLAMGAEVDQGGTPGPYMLEAGISSSYHIARFFRLLEGDVRAAVVSASPPKMRTAPPHASPGDRLAGIRKIDVGAVIADALKAAGLK